MNVDNPETYHIGKICRHCLSSALSYNDFSVNVITGEACDFWYCAGCDRDDLTADDLLDEQEFLRETVPK